MVKNNPNVFEVSTNVVWLFEFSNKQQFLFSFFFVIEESLILIILELENQMFWIFLKKTK
jgi:hypothetical protein